MVQGRWVSVVDIGPDDVVTEVQMQVGSAAKIAVAGAIPSDTFSEFALLVIRESIVHE
jgi:hypothetical protein